MDKNGKKINRDGILLLEKKGRDIIKIVPSGIDRWEKELNIVLGEKLPETILEKKYTAKVKMPDKEREELI